MVAQRQYQAQHVHFTLILRYVEKKSYLVGINLQLKKDFILSILRVQFFCLWLNEGQVI